MLAAKQAQKEQKKGQQMSIDSALKPKENTKKILEPPVQEKESTLGKRAVPPQSVNTVIESL